MPAEDGITFHLEGAFMDTVPGESPRPKDWTGLPVGLAIGHAESNIAVSIDPVIGPVKKLAPGVFQLALQKGHESGKQLVATFVATHPGDNIYKPAVQQAQMLIAPNKDGMDQHITFVPIPNKEAGSSSFTLTAASDAELSVLFDVKEGPVLINGNHLSFTKIPPRSKFPVKVTVVAWQWGRSIEPKVKTAEAVEFSFYITE